MDIKNFDNVFYWFWGFFENLEEIIYTEYCKLNDLGHSSVAIYTIIMEKYGDISPMVEALISAILNPDFTSPGKYKGYDNFVNNEKLGRAEALRVMMERDRQIAKSEGRELTDEELREKYDGIEMMEDVLKITSTFNISFNQVWNSPLDIRTKVLDGESPDKSVNGC